MNSKPKRVFRPVALGIEKMLGEIFISGHRTPSVLKNGFSANRKWGGRDRRLVAEMIYDSVRWWRRLCTMNQIEWSDELLPWTPGDSGGFTQEQVTKNLELMFYLKGFEVEAISECQAAVRKFEQGSHIPAVVASCSDQFFGLGKSELGEAWEETLRALNEPAPVFLRMNPLKVDRLEKLKNLLADEGVETQTVEGSDLALQLVERKNVFTTKAYKQGWFEMQDASSQRVAPIVGAKPGEKIVDACAGAGGKTLHLSAVMNGKGRIIALDVTAWKLEELRKRASRAGADNIETKVIEGSKTIKRLANSADAVLLDVPCSGSGVLRRNADPKWMLTRGELDEKHQLQAKIVTEYSKMVKPGGRLIYSTCSVFPSENQGQVKAALNGALEGWGLEEEFINLPQMQGFDGFYAARLRRPES